MFFFLVCGMGLGFRVLGLGSGFRVQGLGDLGLGGLGLRAEFLGTHLWVVKSPNHWKKGEVETEMEEGLAGLSRAGLRITF